MSAVVPEPAPVATVPPRLGPWSIVTRAARLWWRELPRFLLLSALFDLPLQPVQVWANTLETRHRGLGVATALLVYALLLVLDAVRNVALVHLCAARLRDGRGEGLRAALSGALPLWGRALGSTARITLAVAAVLVPSVVLTAMLSGALEMFHVETSIALHSTMALQAILPGAVLVLFSMAFPVIVLEPAHRRRPLARSVELTRGHRTRLALACLIPLVVLLPLLFARAIAPAAWLTPVSEVALRWTGWFFGACWVPLAVVVHRDLVAVPDGAPDVGATAA